jgi:hypothetical protein
VARRPKTSPHAERRPRERAPLRRALCAVVAGALASATAAGATPASAAEAPTPQAIAANAAFLAYAPPPPKPVKVCVVDTGVDLTTDAAPTVVERYAVDGGTLDDVGGGGLDKHGTYVAGTIASQRDGRGSVGIWPQAKVVSVRVFDPETGTTSVAAYLHGLDRCRLAGASVVNLSLSGLDQADSVELAMLENKVADLRGTYGINVVAAAGNSGGPVGYPARSRDALAVGASDGAGALCSFSSRGEFLDISAFGCGVKLSLPDGGTATGGGTSLAAPVVSAALAALRGYKPTLDVGTAEALLLDSAATRPAGPVLDVTAAFRVAGLESLLEATTPGPSPRPLAPVAPRTSTAPTLPTPDVGAARGAVDATPTRPVGPLAELGVGRPRLRTSGYRRGVLRVLISGVPDFGRAVFSVRGRRYVRSSGKLTLRIKRPPTWIAVAINVPGIGQTERVTLKLNLVRRR